MMPVGACPACGGVMTEETVRRTPVGVLCMECAFKQSLNQTRERVGAAAPGAAGTAAQSDSLMIGLVAGLVCGIVGLIAVWVLGRGPEMKKGALYGFFIQLALGMAIRLMQYGH